MAIRRAQLGDRQQIVDIWQQNRAIIQSYWPEGPDRVPVWTLANAQAHLDAGAHFAVSVTAGVINAFLVVQSVRSQPDFDTLLVMAIRLDDAVGTPTQQRAFLRARLRTEGKALLLAWGNDALSRGVGFCEGAYPLGGNASMLEMLSNMNAANGVVGDLSRSGWVVYRPTPTQLITGLGGVV